MKEFTSHIDYLIQKHDCVIIPDFGGFVLNREVASVAADGSITPPRVIVGFNPDLKYNDGLLAESYMNAYSISYDAACKRLTDVVKRLNTVLNLRQPIEIGRLGKLSLGSDNRLNFEPNVHLSAFHPETFGLSVLDIKRLVDIKEIQEISIITTRRSLYRRAFAGVGAAAAAILVFFVTSTPISENEIANTQQSGFFTDLISTSAKVSNKTETIAMDNLLAVAAEDADAVENTTPDAPIETIEVEIKKEEPKIEKVAPAVTQKVEPTPKATKPTETAKKVEAQKNAEPKFFVIIGSAGSKSEAQNALKRFKLQGYKDANIVTSNDRNRIYVASFTDKAQAEKYLASFKKNNPKLNDAWVFSRKN